MWLDTTNTQLYVYTGSAWTLIGPTTVVWIRGHTGDHQKSPEDNAGVNQSYSKISCQMTRWWAWHPIWHSLRARTEANGWRRTGRGRFLIASHRVSSFQRHLYQVSKIQGNSHGRGRTGRRGRGQLL